MIPKIIHYCWLSGEEYPGLIKRCMDSWKRKLPGWEFRLWDSGCLEQIGFEYVREAYDARIYAYAADVIRLWAVYNYGGFYLDTDVEVVKDLSPLTVQPYVFGLENGTGNIEAAVFGAEPGFGFVGRCLDFYRDKHCVVDGRRIDDYTIPGVMKDLVGPVKYLSSEKDFDPSEKRIQVYGCQFLSPKSFLGTDKSGLASVTEDTYTYHHFKLGWLPFWKKVSVRVRQLLGPRLSEPVFKVLDSVRTRSLERHI